MSAVMRVIVVPIIQNDAGKILLCRMPTNRGAYPGQWALPGGGIEPGERMEEALHREIKEELGIAVREIKPWTFSDGASRKIMENGEKRDVYMIFLMFDCRTSDDNVVINDEFDDYNWVSPGDLKTYDLNPPCLDTFRKKGYIESDDRWDGSAAHRGKAFGHT